MRPDIQARIFYRHQCLGEGIPRLVQYLNTYYSLDTTIQQVEAVIQAHKAAAGRL